MVLSLIACGAKEDETQAGSNSSAVESNINSGDSNIPVVETNSDDKSTFISETEDFAEENVNSNSEANDASAQSQSNEPFTIDSCAGTYLSTNGDTFTFESDSSSGSYSVKDFVLNGAAVEENLYPYFGNANFTEKDDGSIEVMTGVGGTNPNDGYIFLFKKDGTADVTQITMTMGPVGSAVTFNKQ